MCHESGGIGEFPAFCFSFFIPKYVLRKSQHRAVGKSLSV